jgi:hypothetical protein
MDITFPSLPPLRHANHFIVYGDSRMAQIFADASTKRQRAALHFFNQANCRLGRRMRIVGHYAVSGLRSDEYITAANIDAGIATDAKYAMIFGVVNDIAFNTSADPFTTVIKPACERLIAAGITPILFTDPGSTSLAGTTAARTALQRYNALCQQYAAQDRAFGQVLCFDLAGLVMNLATTTIAFKTGYSADGTHYTINMAVIVGRAFAAFIGPLIPALPARKVYGGETNALGLQLNANPAFLTTTGGSVGGMSGTAPSGVTNCLVETGISATIGTAANADGSNDLTLAATATQAGRARVIMDLASGDNAGDLIDLKGQIEIASGAVNLASAYLLASVQRNAATQDFAELYSITATDGVMPADVTETLDQNVPIVVAAGTRGFFSVRLVLYFAGAGSASVKLRHLALDKRAA